MTKEEKDNYNKMLAALHTITQYQSPDELRETHWETWGLESYEECLEMAYENIQALAQQTVHGLDFFLIPVEHKKSGFDERLEKALEEQRRVRNKKKN